MKICVSLWGKSHWFVGKITLVCGKNSVNKVKCWKIPVSLWEKFVGLKKPPENTRRYTGKNYRIMYVYLPRYRISQRLFDGKFAETLNSVLRVYIPMHFLATCKFVKVWNRAVLEVMGTWSCLHLCIHPFLLHPTVN